MLEPMQEEVFKITEQIAVLQGKVKQAVQENEEKLQTPITMEDEK
jgi:hypothetical protein